MRVSIMAALAACALTVPACKKNEKKAEAPPPTAPVKPAEPAAEKPAEPPADSMLNDMKNCPNAVDGAITTATMDKTTVTATIVAGKAGPADAMAEIRTRAHKLLDAAKPAGAEVKHTGEGTGGGALGKCPSMIPGATAKVEDVDGGVKITYTLADPAKLHDVHMMIEERVKSMGAAAPAAVPAPAEPAAPAPADGAAKK